MIDPKFISSQSNAIIKHKITALALTLFVFWSCDTKDKISKYPADFAYIEQVNTNVEQGVFSTQHCKYDCDSSRYYTGKLVYVVLDAQNQITKAHLQNNNENQELNEDYFFKGDTLVAAEISFTNISKNNTLKNWHIAYLFSHNQFFEYDFSSKQKKQMDTSALYLNEFRELRNYIFRTYNSKSFAQPDVWDKFQEDTFLLKQLHKASWKENKNNIYEYHYAEDVIHNITHHSKDQNITRDSWFSDDSTLVKYACVAPDGQDDFVIEKGRIVNFKYLDRSRSKFGNKPEHQIVAELNAIALKDKELVKEQLKKK